MEFHSKWNVPQNKMSLKMECQPISQYPISNPQSWIPNLQLEKPNCAFYPQLGILPVSSLMV